MTQLDAIEDAEIFQAFITEVRETTELLGPLLIKLEEAPEDQEIVNQIFRAIHTVKGNAGFFGFETLEAVAHAGENLLSGVRAQEIVVDQGVIDILLECSDAIVAVVEYIDEQMAEPDERYTSLRARLITKADQGAAPEASDQSAGTSGAEEPIVDGSAQGQPSNSEPESESDRDQAVVNEPEPDPRPAVVVPTKGSPAPKPRRAAGDKSAVEPTIRVQVRLIEDLMNQVGELVLARNQLLQHVDNGDFDAIERASQGLDHVTSGLQENMLKTRLQPVGIVFGKFPRIVRDLARMSDKLVKLNITGESTEVDKTLLEAIADPLTHIIRNAIDHGLEGKEEREAAGKPAQGTISIAAAHEGEHVVISVVDDGRGIDTDKVVAKALSRGLLTESEAGRLSHRQAVNLIFAPGFSTADKVTNISGRGVGMDVVKTAVERVNGLIDIDTAVGRGSTFRLVIPLTLAIIPALNVRVGGELLAIPQVNTVEVVCYEGPQIEQQVHTLRDVELIFFREEWVPIVYLDVFLRLPKLRPRDSHGERTLFIVVVRSGTQQLGLVVDHVVDTEEIVVKPLISHLRKIGCYAGTTLGGNGRVHLILDVAGIMRVNNLGQAEPRRVQRLPEKANDVQPLLLCSMGAGVKIAVPLVLVARIEEVAASSLQAVGERLLMVYWDRLLPILQLDRHLPVPAVDVTEDAQVLLFEFGDRQVGFLIEKVLDAIDYDGDIDSGLIASDGVLGSVLIDAEAIMVADIFRVIEMEDPDWFAGTRKSRGVPQKHGVSVLLAEDSDFFRNIVRGYLESAGCEVTAAPDGAVALELFTAGAKFDIVVTDLEMPNMNGWDLCEAIRGTPAGAEIPIVAVSSLNSEAARARAFAAGVDSYVVKLKREQMITAVFDLLGRPELAERGAA